MNKKIITLFIILNVFFLAADRASALTGTILNGFTRTKVCHDPTCSSPVPGILNMKPTGATTPVTVDDFNGIDGIGWGSEIGWVLFDPTGPEGVLVNPATGVLTGKAWAQASGWVNFSVTGQQVVINCNGEFDGWAWTGGPYGGWIDFDCSNPGKCVKTDWVPQSCRATNDELKERSYEGCADGDTPLNKNCEEKNNDLCINIDGYQDRVPTSYARDLMGICMPFPVDEGEFEYDPNPESKPKDLCPNFEGTQSVLPKGYELLFNQCVAVAIDMCPNIIGFQKEIPFSNTVSEEGKCIYFEGGEKLSDYKYVLRFGIMPAKIGRSFGIPWTGGYYRVDIPSLLLLLFAGLGLGRLLWILLWRRRVGKVFDSLTGDVLEGATVYLYDEKGEPLEATLTNRKGIYKFKMRPGVYYLTVTYPNYVFPSEHMKGITRTDSGQDKKLDFENINSKPYAKLKYSLFSDGECNIPIDSIN